GSRPGVSSAASSAGRMNGTSAPAACAAAAISASSVLTTTAARPGASSAASIVQAISGLPAIGRTFLRGIPLEPPRAGIRPSVLTGAAAAGGGRTRWSYVVLVRLVAPQVRRVRKPRNGLGQPALESVEPGKLRRPPGQLANAAVVGP